MTPEQRETARKREGGATVSDRQRCDRPHLTLVPISLKVANAYVAEHHRHNRPVAAGVCVVGVREEERLCGVAIIGRPVARMLDDGYTAEVRRVCTDGTYNACSMLLRAAWRAVKALGYSKLITYTLPEEGGASLRAAGFKLVKTDAGGGRWNQPGRPAADTHPLGHKYRWELPT
ncbi:MAG TPA: XF1762 family protein [Solirubrobacterales bacterium]|nr:XF1762 family protein [Solirubrobacterales bacterium]